MLNNENQLSNEELIEILEIHDLDFCITDDKLLVDNTHITGCIASFENITGFTEAQIAKWLGYQETLLDKLLHIGQGSKSHADFFCALSEETHKSLVWRMYCTYEHAKGIRLQDSKVESNERVQELIKDDVLVHVGACTMGAGTIYSVYRFNEALNDIFESWKPQQQVQAKAVAKFGGKLD